MNIVPIINALSDGIGQLNRAGYQTIDPSKFEFAKHIIMAYDKHLLIQGFINKSHETYWDRILQRDEGFFIENAGTIFAELPTNDVNVFRDLFTATRDGKKVISENLRNQLWKLFDSLVKISIKYVHKHRYPISETDESGNNIVQKYRHSFFDYVDVANHASKWKVALDFPVQY